MSNKFRFECFKSNLSCIGPSKFDLFLQKVGQGCSDVGKVFYKASIIVAQAQETL